MLPNTLLSSHTAHPQEIPAYPRNRPVQTIPTNASGAPNWPSEAQSHPYTARDVRGARYRTQSLNHLSRRGYIRKLMIKSAEMHHEDPATLGVPGKPSIWIPHISGSERSTFLPNNLMLDPRPMLMRITSKLTAAIRKGITCRYCERTRAFVASIMLSPCSRDALSASRKPHRMRKNSIPMVQHARYARPFGEKRVLAWAMATTNEKKKESRQMSFDVEEKESSNRTDSPPSLRAI
jgi:hypothetical protein